MCNIHYAGVEEEYFKKTWEVTVAKYKVMYYIENSIKKVLRCTLS